MEEIVKLYIERVERAIEKAESGETKLTDLQLKLHGMSSKKNRIFLNEIIYPDTKYLEIGVWQGSTFISAMYNNKPDSAFAIDNFSQFQGAFDKFYNNCFDNKIPEFTFVNHDCFTLVEYDKKNIQDVNVYFYDGDHTEEDQRKALTYYLDNLAKYFIFIVDDWNHEPAKNGTKKGIEETKIKVHKEWELTAHGNGDINGWWNGWYVAVMEKE
jgi:hypothetical protein